MAAMSFKCNGLLSFLVSCLLPVSCSDVLEESSCLDECIRFEIKEENMPLVRSMSERTSVTGFTCLALKSDNSVLVNNMVTARSGSGEILAGRYWPSSGSCSFFGVLPNVSMTNSSGTVTFPVGTPSSRLTGNEDYVFASRRNAANGKTVSMTFSHILSNVAGLKLTGEKEGTRTTVTAVTLSHPGYGTYQCAEGGDSWVNLGTEETTPLSTSFSSASHASGSVIEGKETGISFDNISVIPGNWTIRVRYNVTAGSETRSYDKSGRVSFVAGKKCTVSATLTNDVGLLNLSVSVSDWEHGNSATAWVEDFMPGASISFNLNGEWQKCGTALYSEPEKYYGIFEPVPLETGTIMALKTMYMTVSGLETFRFYVSRTYTGNEAYSIAVSKPDQDLLNEFPSIMSMYKAYWLKEGNAPYFMTTGNPLSNNQAASILPSRNDVSGLYSEVVYNDLDPMKEYRIQVVTSIANIYGTADSFVYVPKEEYQK